MNSSNHINSDTFASAVAELATQVDGPDGRWLGPEVTFPIAEAIVARIDGTVSHDRVSDLFSAVSLKGLWDCVIDRDHSRKFDAVVAELAAQVPSKSREEIRDLATRLVERADGTEFADPYRVYSLERAADLMCAWTHTPEPVQLALAA
jgi:hypothetical protein